jgi:dipeptidyl-peptidase-3
MRDLLEEILTHAAGVPPATLAAITRYTKLFWLNTGPYNNLTARKFLLPCSPADFRQAAHAAQRAGACVPTREGETLDQLLDRLGPAFFDPSYDRMVTNKTPGPGRDILRESANNLYDGVAMADLDHFQERHPLNSRLVKREGTLVEEVYRVGGRYDAQISAIVSHLRAAIPYAGEAAARALAALVRFYETGEAEDRRQYDIAWVQDQASPVDAINGFVEVYLDARGIKGSWESVVFCVNREKTEGIRRLAHEAQWFEDHMPWAPEYRKQGVTGVTGRAIEVIVETGDTGPISPIGINLPNDQGVRERYGSKSVLLINVLDACERSTPPAFRSEFSWTPEEAARAERWGPLAGELTTTMHEVIGHGSGKVSERLKGNPQAALKEQFSALEESRADLVALYYLPDPKLVELGLVPGEDQPAIVQAEYEAYARNALVQLRRVREGTQLEKDHMRNRQMIAHWLIANTSAIAVRQRDGKTYYAMVDADAFRQGVARLLGEVQRIWAEGDYPAAKALFERHGVHFDAALRDEVVARVDHLDLPSYTGFVMPRLEAIRGEDGEITDVRISYPLDLTAQMLEYSGRLMDDAIEACHSWASAGCRLTYRCILHVPRMVAASPSQTNILLIAAQPSLRTANPMPSASATPASARNWGALWRRATTRNARLRMRPMAGAAVCSMPAALPVTMSCVSDGRRTRCPRAARHRWSSRERALAAHNGCSVNSLAG